VGCGSNAAGSLRALQKVKGEPALIT
jgi:hypothetical protein